MSQGTTDFFVRLVPGFAERLGLQQASLLAASLPDDDSDDDGNEDDVDDGNEGDCGERGVDSNRGASSSSRSKSARGNQMPSNQASRGSQDALTSAFAAANRRQSNSGGHDEENEDDDEEEDEEDYSLLTDGEDFDDDYDFAESSGEEGDELALLPVHDWRFSIFMLNFLLLDR